MEIYYHPQDLPKFEEIGEEVPELAKKFFTITQQYLLRVSLQKGKRL